MSQLYVDIFECVRSLSVVVVVGGACVWGEGEEKVEMGGGWWWRRRDGEEGSSRPPTWGWAPVLATRVQAVLRVIRAVGAFTLSVKVKVGVSCAKFHFVF